MADTKRKASQVIDLEKLTQRQASWLIDKPAVWLRDNANLPGCNVDGSYHARELVRTMLGAGAVVELPDAEREQLFQIAENAAHEAEMYRPAAAQLLRRIAERDGAGGLAAIGAMVVAQFERVAREFTSPHAVDRTPDEIRAECEQRIAALGDPDRRAADELRVLEDCRECRAFRFAGQWRKGKLPRGFVRATEFHGFNLVRLCPQCEAKQ